MKITLAFFCLLAAAYATPVGNSNLYSLATLFPNYIVPLHEDQPNTPFGTQ